MNIFTELVKWVNDRKLPFWEQYALDLIVAGKGIGDAEVDDMITYLLEDGGVLKKESTRPQLSALSKAVASSKKQSIDKIVVRGITKTKNVNALVPAQKIEFGDQLTVIYGANGSGKSGYSRFIANAGFSRGDREVLHDITEPKSKGLQGEAIFLLEQNGKAFDVPYVVGADCPHLQKLYVHDSVSIISHLTERNEFSFSPFGLDLLGELAEVTDMVSAGLQQRIGEWSNDHSFSDKFEGESIVRTQVENLSQDTDIAALETLAIVSEEDQSRKKELELQIAKLRARSVQGEIKKITQQVTDLKNLINQLMGMVNGTGPQIVRTIETALENLKQCKEQAKKVGIEQFKTDLFREVGSETWQRFIESAHDLAQAEDETYPHNGDHCLLCRQELKSSAIALLQNYWKFLEDDSRQKIKNTEAALAKAKDSLDDLETDFFMETSVAYRLIEKEDAELLEDIKSFVSSAQTRKKELIKTIASKKSAELPKLSIEPIPALRKLIETMEAKIATLKASDPAKEIAKLEDQLRLLKHREKLFQLLGAIKKYISDLKNAAKARRLAPNTAHISHMQGRLFDTLVTEEYMKRFKQNLLELGRPLPVDVRTRNNKGTSMKEIVVHKGEYEPVKILSDGEKRVASLADFLTEVSLDPDAIGIVLDDPVTSLDIEWKDEVAKRLVDESRIRQTIIFTHDLHFVYLLKQAAESSGVDMKTHWIVRDGMTNRPGCIYLNNSPATEKDYKNCAIAEDHFKKAKIAGPQDQEQLLRNGFSALRTSYEAIVMYELFAGVVERFQERTRIDLLDRVVLDKTIFDRVREKHGYLSRFMEGHSHSDEFAAKKPTLELLKKELDDFNTLRGQIRTLKASATQ